MISVLSDRHHSSLWISLELLCKRLGWKLFCPYGMDWYDKGYFKLYGDLRKKDPYRAIAKQYLEDTIFDGYFRETKYGCIDYPKPNLLTFEQMKETPIDIVMCTVHENEPYFLKLKEFWPKAKFIRQVGNNLDTIIDEEGYPNLLASAMAPYEAYGGHKVLYRQEFDLNLFKYSPPTQFRNIYSFQNDLEEFEETWDWWMKLQHGLKDYKFKSYGAGNKEGTIYPMRDYIKEMQESSLLFHCKQHDGFGHYLHNAMALGRPLVLKMEYYRHGLITPMLVDGETCIDLNDMTEQRIKYFTKPDVLREMSENCINKFREIVNFDRDFIEVKKFMEDLR